MNKFDTMNYLSKGVVAFGLFSVYDTLVEGKEFSGYSIRDGGTFALSTVVAEWSADLLSSVWPQDIQSVSGMLTKPVLNGLVYLWLFNYMVRPEYEDNRDNTRNFVMAALGEVLLSYVTNPIVAMFSGVKKY
jgi:hypothetical protein